MKTLEEAVKIINGSPYYAMGLSAAERGVAKMVRVEINEYQFSALVSLLISIGSKAFRESQVLKLTNKRWFLLAASHFSEYTINNGKEDAGLIARRNKERRLYTTMTLPVNNGKTQGIVE